MASFNFALFQLVETCIPKIALILLYTLGCILIALLFLICFLFSLFSKSASFFSLQTPCILCSLLAFKKFFDDLTCNDHITKISQFRRPKRKKKKKDARVFNYVIFGPPWRVVEYASKENLVHEILKKGCVVEEERCDKSDSGKDDSLNLHQRCVINKERLVPVELIDNITLAESSNWFNEQNRKLIPEGSLQFLPAPDIDMKTSGDGKAKTKLTSEYISTGTHYPSPRKTTQNYKYRSRNSFEIAPPLSNAHIRSEPSLKLGEEKEKTNKLLASSKSLDSSLLITNQDNKHLHRRDQNTSSYKSLFEITHLSDKHEEEASSLERKEEEIDESHQ